METDGQHSILWQLPLPYACLKPICSETDEIIDYEVMDVNAAFEKQFSVTLKDSLHQRVSRLIHGFNHAQFALWVNQMGDSVSGESNLNYFDCGNQIFKLLLLDGDTSCLRVLFQDVTQEHLSYSRLKRFNETILRLVSSPNYIEGNIYQFINELTEISSEMMRTNRVGVWFFDENLEKLREFDTYVAEGHKHQSGKLFTSMQCMDEFFLMQQNSYIDSLDAADDSRLRAYRDAYILPLGISSLLDVSIRNEDRVQGMLCFEHTGEKRKWTKEEIDFAQKLATHININLGVFQKKIFQNELKDNEEKLKSIFRAAPIGIGLTQNRKILEANDTFCKMLGYSKDQVLGESASMLYFDHTEYERVGKEKYAQMKLKGVGILDTLFKRKDGTPIHIQLSSTYVDKDNPGKGVTFTALDISKRKAAEAKLLASKNLFKTLADSAPVGIFQANKHGQTTYVNASWLKLSGLKYKEAMNKDWMKSVHPNDKERVIKGWKRAYGAAKESNQEFRFLLPDGTIHWVQGRAVPVFDDNGQLWSYMGTLTDITKLKTINQRLKDLESEAKALLNAIPDMMFRLNAEGVFLAYKAHERNLFYKNSSIIGKKMSEIMPKHITSLFEKHLSNGISGEKLAIVEYDLELEHRGMHTFEARLVPGAGSEIIAIVRDLGPKK